MLDVVATTPSSPLGACRLVTLEMAPRWRADRSTLLAAQKRSGGATLFYTPRRREFPGARLAGKCARRRINGLPMEQVRYGRSPKNYPGEVHDDKTNHSRPHPYPGSTPGPCRRGYVVIQRLPERSGPEAIRNFADAGMAGPPATVVGAL